MKKKLFNSCNGCVNMECMPESLVIDLFLQIPILTITCILLVYYYPTWLQDILGEYGTIVLIWHEYIIDCGTMSIILISLGIYLALAVITALLYLIVGLLCTMAYAIVWLLRNCS